MFGFYRCILAGIFLTCIVLGEELNAPGEEMNALGDELNALNEELNALIDVKVEPQVETARRIKVTERNPPSILSVFLNPVGHFLQHLLGVYIDDHVSSEDRDELNAPTFTTALSIWPFTNHITLQSTSDIVTHALTDLSYLWTLFLQAIGNTFSLIALVGLKVSAIFVPALALGAFLALPAFGLVRRREDNFPEYPHIPEYPPIPDGYDYFEYDQGKNLES